MLPGLAAATVVALVATGSSRLSGLLLPTPLSAVPLALLIGAVAGRWLPERPLAAGVAMTSRRVLRVGIVLLGARLSLADIGAIGSWSVVLIVATIVTAFGVARLLGARLGLSRSSLTLIAVGSAICGNTAILATAPMIRARSRDVGLAVAAITVWGSLAVIVMPPLARAAGMADAAFGILVGLAVQDTAQVVAAATAHSAGAVEAAAVVKLVRNTAMAAVLPIVAWWWTRSAKIELPASDRSSPEGQVAHDVDAAPRTSTWRMPRWSQTVPAFVVGFLAMAALRTVGVIDAALAEMFTTVSTWAILLAVAALGLGLKLAELRRPGGAGFVLAGVIAAVLVVVALLGIGGLRRLGLLV